MSTSNQSIREGAKVTTLKGSRHSGSFTGTVVGTTSTVWGKAAMVRKSSGQVVRCLVSNLITGAKPKKEAAPKKAAPKKKASR